MGALWVNLKGAKIPEFYAICRLAPVIARGFSVFLLGGVNSRVYGVLSLFMAFYRVLSQFIAFYRVLSLY
jgi:hypothetical protein